MTLELMKAPVEKCIDSLFDDFADSPHSFYLENTVHCHVYHLLAEAGLNGSYRTQAGYMVRQLQKEYPPVLGTPGSRRGQFDLVILDAEGINTINEWNHRRDGNPIGPSVAIELGLNKGFVNDPEKIGSPDIDKELERLAEPANQVGWGFLLYLYRYATYQVEPMEKLIRLVEGKVRAEPRASAFIKAIGFDVEREYAPIEQTELRIEGGVTNKREGALASDQIS